MKTSIDWLGFRTRSTPFQVVESMAPMFGTCSELVTFKPGLKGKDGWVCAGEIQMAGDINLGRIDYGGESQRGWVRINLTGQGCEWVQDWEAAVALSRVLLEPQIKRLDIALTTNLGEVSDETIVQAYAAGKFTMGGRPPEMRSITSSDARAGKTRYIGSRQSHKFLRCYEKGFELIKDLPHFKGSVTHIGEHKIEEIYRVELEMKAVEKLIPWETITARDEVFAGAYPFCAELLPGCPHWRMLSLPDEKPKAALLKQLHFAKVSYGGAFRAGLIACNGDADKLLAMIMADQPSPKLVEAGVLTVDHF